MRSQHRVPWSWFAVTSALLDGNDRTSQVPGQPWCACHALGPRWGGPGLAFTTRTATAFWFPQRRRPHEFGTFEAQSRGLLTRCLRFAARVAPVPRKTRYRPAGYALVGRDFHPLGCFLEFLGFGSSFPLEPGFSWRNVDMPGLRRGSALAVRQGLRWTTACALPLGQTRRRVCPHTHSPNCCFASRLQSQRRRDGTLAALGPQTGSRSRRGCRPPPQPRPGAATAPAVSRAIAWS